MLLAALLALTSAGCEHRRYLEPPPLGDAQAMVVAIDGQGVTAVDLVKGMGAIELAAPTGEERGLVEVLLYASSLEALGLSVGLIPPPAPGEEPRGLPQSAVVYEQALEVDDGWITNSTVSEALAAFRWGFEAISPCYPFQTEMEVLPTRTGLSFAVPAWHYAALVSSGRRFWIVEAHQTTPLTLEGPTALYPTAATLDPDDGVFIVASANGALYSGRIEGSVLSLATFGSSTPGPTAMASGSNAGRREIFAVTVDPDQTRSTFGRFFDGQWTTLHQFDELTLSEEYAGLVRLGPGAAIAGRVVAPEVVRWSNGTLLTETPAGSTVGIASLAEIPGLGILAGTSLGSILQNNGDRWLPLVDTDSDFSITALAPFEDGFLFSISTGAFGYFTPAHGVCLHRDPVPSAPRAIIPLAPDTWLLAGDRRAGALDPVLTRVTVLRAP